MGTIQGVTMTLIDQVEWENISSQPQTEDFIRSNKDKVSWYCISIYQNNLSPEFIEEFKDKLNFTLMVIHNKLSITATVKYKDLINWSELYNCKMEGFDYKLLIDSIRFFMVVDIVKSAYEAKKILDAVDYVNTFPKHKPLEVGFVKSKHLPK